MIQARQADLRLCLMLRKSADFLNIDDHIIENRVSHQVGRATPDAADKARPTVNRLTAMNFIKLNQKKEQGI
jgi:hypothetical protein